MSFAGRKDHAAAVAAAEEKVARNRRDFEAAAAEVAAVEEALAQAEAQAVERQRKAGSKSPQRRKQTFDWSTIGSVTAGPAGAVDIGGRASTRVAERSFEDELRITTTVPQQQLGLRQVGASTNVNASRHSVLVDAAVKKHVDGHGADDSAALLDGIAAPAGEGSSHASFATAEKNVEELMKESEAAFSQVRVISHRKTPIRACCSGLAKICRVT